MKAWWIGVLLIGVAVIMLSLAGGQSDRALLSASTGTVCSTEACASIQHEIFVGDPGKPVLFLVEEDHASLAVQQEVALTVEAVSKTSLAPMLLVEGSSPERLDLSDIYGLTNDSLRLAAAEAWFELGWLSGAEMAALRIPDLPVYGLEHPASSERTRNLDALNHQQEVYTQMLNEVFTLYSQLLSLKEPLETIDAAFARVEEARAALSQPVEGELQFSTVLSVLREGLTDKMSVREALEQPKLVFEGVATAYSIQHKAFEGAIVAWFKEIVKAAEEHGVNTSKCKVLLEQYKQAVDDELAARKDRDRVMIANAVRILSGQAHQVGIMIVGSGHTLSIEKLLRAQEISYIVLTPHFLSAQTPEREVGWYNRARKNDESLEVSPPPREWLGKGTYKAPMILSYPEARKSLGTVIAILDVVGKVLSGEQPHLPSNTLITDVQSRFTGKKLDLTFVGISGRKLNISLPQDFRFSPAAAKELIKHLGEASQALNPLTRYPAVHMYVDAVEEGGAFISYVKDNTLYVQGVNFAVPSSVSSVVQAYENDLLGSLSKLGGIDPTKVQKEEPSDLLVPLGILRPVIKALGQALDDIGVPDDQIAPIALRLPTPKGTNGSRVSLLRKIDFTALDMLARFSSIPGYERKLLFVNSGLETDSDRIKVGDWEHCLVTTETNIGRWGKTTKHLAVITVPTQEAEWVSNPFANDMRTNGWTWTKYKEDVLPYIDDAIKAVGQDNVIEPSNPNELLLALPEKLADSKDATITLTLVAHSNEKEEPSIFFKSEETKLSKVINQIKQLEQEGKIPTSVNLEFNVLVCSVGAGGAEEFFKQLDSPLVIASPNPISLSTNMVLLAKVAEKMKQDGKPLWQAYFEVKEWFIQELLTKTPKELEAEGIRYFETPGVISEVSSNNSTT